MKLKKTVLIIALLVVVLSLVACGSSSDTAGESVSAGESTYTSDDLQEAYEAGYNQCYEDVSEDFVDADGNSMLETHVLTEESLDEGLNYYGDFVGGHDLSSYEKKLIKHYIRSVFEDHAGVFPDERDPGTYQ